jgi:hypothetical protein
MLSVRQPVATTKAEPVADALCVAALGVRLAVALGVGVGVGETLAGPTGDAAAGVG